MPRAVAIIRKPAVRAERVVDSVTLDHEGRHRRRVALVADNGLDILLDLDKAAALNDGDALRLEDGGLVLVRAAAQQLIEITAENPKRLMTIAWHIGNRHTPAEITAQAIYIEDDHVLAEMARGLGGAVTRVTRPFQPERGAYDAGGHGHGCAHGDHSHDHRHGHAHDHAHDHGHDHQHHHSEAGHRHG